MKDCQFGVSPVNYSDSDIPKSTEKTLERRGLYALWITILCVLGNKDVYMWHVKVYDPKPFLTNDY